jgi:hypothetical protein
MKTYFLTALLLVVSTFITAQNITSDSTSSKTTELKLVSGLPEILTKEFDTSGSTYFYSIIPNISQDYNSVFICERRNDGDVLYWWIENDKEKIDLISIYPNDFSLKLPAFSFKNAEEKEKILITTTREIALYKTEKLYVKQSTEKQEIVTTSKVSFYISPSFELQAFVAKYKNHAQEWPPSKEQKEFWKLLSTTRDALPITIAQIGFKTMFVDRHAIEFKVGIAMNNDEKFMSFELGLFYNYFWKSNVFSFLGAQVRGGPTLNAIYYGGGVGYGVNELVAFTLSTYLADAQTYYSGREHSNVNWKALFRFGVQLNY